MTDTVENRASSICRERGDDRSRLLDIAAAAQREFGCVPSAALDTIAKRVGCRRVDVESVVSFYAFLSAEPKGKALIRLCDDVIDEMKGAKSVAKVFCEEFQIEIGQTTPDSCLTLERAPCIGMSDQAPAALINGIPFTSLTPRKARDIARALKRKTDPASLVGALGDGGKAHGIARSMVKNNIRRKDAVIFADFEAGSGLKKALALAPDAVIGAVKSARLRGRGGAGFPTGIKWEFARSSPGEKKYVFCNADEGEPGTFKDRVLLTERADMTFEGMTIAGYAIGAETGVLYLRGEYVYLLAFLESVLKTRRENGQLGRDIAGKKGFNFDIRIQMGAGAYVCGEETALLCSCEGLRGDPKTRPPFPAQKGYMDSPTIVNNVETFCCAARIFEKGPQWFGRIGTKESAGTKLLSVSGDCANPGVFEAPFGVTLREVLEMAGAENPAAVQIGGASGQMVGPSEFGRAICYSDLATGGAVMIFGPGRNILKIAEKFMDFFVEESCGYCAPCRIGNVLLRDRLARIRKGMGEPGDLDYLRRLGETVKLTSRCGLGQTSPNPVLTTLKNFRPVYEALVKEEKRGFNRSFDIVAALAPAAAIAGRESKHF